MNYDEKWKKSVKKFCMRRTTLTSILQHVSGIPINGKVQIKQAYVSLENKGAKTERNKDVCHLE